LSLKNGSSSLHLEVESSCRHSTSTVELAAVICASAVVVYIHLFAVVVVYARLPEVTENVDTDESSADMDG
jgi:hypothetical protein